jgi:hypothetical protein
MVRDRETRYNDNINQYFFRIQNPKTKKMQVCENIFIPAQFMQSCCSVKCAIKHSNNIKPIRLKADWKIEKPF